MCMNERRVCRCGRNSTFLSFRDNLLPPEILLHLYCPQGRQAATWDETARPHRRLAPLVRQDYALYLKTLKTEGSAHVAGLKATGWCKAQAT